MQKIFFTIDKTSFHLLFHTASNYSSF